MSNYRFPASLKPITSKGYSYQRGGNVYRSEVTGGLPRQGRDTYFDTVPFNVTLVTSALGNQAFQSFLNQISGGADSFVMALDSGLGVKDHQCQINSDINIDTSDGINWTISFSLLAERTDIQEETCLTANLPDLFGCYGDGLNCFLAAYATAQTTFPRVWEPNVIAQFNAVAREFVGIGFSRASEGTYIDGSGVFLTAAVNTPRYEADGLLVEPLATNLMPYSEFPATVPAYTYTRTSSRISPSVNSGAMVFTVTVAGILQWAEFTSVSVSYPLGDYIASVETVQLPVTHATYGLRFMNYDVVSGDQVAGDMVYTGEFLLAQRCAVPTTTVKTGRLAVRLMGYGGPNVNVGDTMTLRRPQIETGHIVTSYIPTNGAPATRAPDVLTLQVGGAKRVYREYTPLGSSTPVSETVLYTGELCPPGHVRVIKVLND